MSSTPGNSGDEVNEPTKVKLIMAGAIAFMLFGTLFLYLLIFGSDSENETNLGEAANGTKLEPEKAAGSLQDISASTSQLPNETTASKQQESLQPAKPTQPEHQAGTAQVKVLVMSYFPLQGSNLDSGITGMSDSLDSIRSKVSQLTASTADSLTKGSTYHGYKDSNAKPSLQYTVIDTKEFLKAEPVSANQIPWNPNAFRPDYRLMLTSDVNVCDYVDNQNVKEVWVWGYHHGNIEPVESNMAMGTASQAYWNHGSYGDVSNSEQSDDLPTCTKSYTLYNYNYGRELGESLENHGHHIESLLSFTDATLWNRFQYPFGEPVPVVNSCGWTHTGPNSKEQYDPGWTSETTLKSNCEDWHPDGSGEVKDVNCHTWYGQTCLFNSGVEFKLWWMQNIPGINNGLAYQGRQMRSWWDFIADFDSAIAKGKSMTS